ncbi:MAG: D-alanyl-D-alanine carboxypeptidase [Clostridium sp.]|nr:D-alanyl-D-alanine carboxypeptidase [Clostridium sp.]MCI7442613.1 D-alanyl-D-alanine carboxypeptidase [Clostridium sp.]
MNKKKIYIFYAILLVMLFLTNFNYKTVYAETNPPDLNSKGVVLMDATTGEVLYSKEENTHYYPASTTKVLTALVVLENVKNLDEKVTVGKNPPFADGTKIGLREGDTFTVRELLTILLLASDNVAAETLAEYVSGSCEKFAKLMNEKAKSIGAVNSNFKNPSGLPDEEHITTPKDLAIIMKEAIKNQDFIKISNENYIELHSVIDDSILATSNHNYMLLPDSSYYYENSIAAKKGYTIAAGFTNVAAAEKDGLTLVASFLSGEDINQVYDDVKKIFDYGFENFKRVKLYTQGDEVGSFTLEDGTKVPLLIANDVYHTLKNDENLDSKLEFTNPKGYDKKSFKRGEMLTKAKVIVNGEEVENIDLASGISRDYKSSIEIFSKSASSLTFYIKIIVAIIIIIFIYLLLTRKKRLFKKKHKRCIQLIKDAKKRR